MKVKLELEKMIANKDQWPILKKKFKLCTEDDVELLHIQIMSALGDLTQYYVRNLPQFCDIMGNEKFGNPVDRFAIIYKQKHIKVPCTSHRYEHAIRNKFITNIETADGSRQWLWQKCSEFGWFKSGNFLYIVGSNTQLGPIELVQQV